MGSKSLLTLVYSYYNNFVMLHRQIEEWDKYSQFVRDRLSIVITDDNSKKMPMPEIDFPEGVKGLQYRITGEKVPWNWLACRNIGAFHAKSKWLLLTDMDHMLSVGAAESLMHTLVKGRIPEDWIYLFTRVDAPDNIPYKPHNDSFLMTKEMYWKVGGYDEELAGNYGTSGRYRRRAFDIAKANKRLGIPLTRFPREVISDASTTEFVRKGKGRDPHAIRNIELKKEVEGRADEVLTMSFPYERIK